MREREGERERERASHRQHGSRILVSDNLYSIHSCGCTVYPQDTSSLAQWLQEIAGGEDRGAFFRFKGLGNLQRLWAWRCQNLMAVNLTRSNRREASHAASWMLYAGRTHWHPFATWLETSLTFLHQASAVFPRGEVCLVQSVAYSECRRLHI